MKFKCENCGDVDYVLLDGYRAGDRLLEGVMFEIKVKHEKYQDILAVDVQDKEYMKGLNRKKWEILVLEDALEDIKNNGCCSMICPKCNESEVILFEE